MVEQIEYEHISLERERAGWQEFSLWVHRGYIIQSGIPAPAIAGVTAETVKRSNDGWTTTPVFPISDAAVDDADDEFSDTDSEDVYKDKGGKRMWMRAILALLGNASHAAAAKEAGISGRQLVRWKKLPEFQKLYSQTKEQLYREAVTGMKSTLTKAGIVGAQTLKDIAEDTKASDNARVAAARALTQLALEINDLEQLAADIAALKAQKE